jgi:hypothetical protein
VGPESRYDIQEIMALVGMASKPLHCWRLQKALQEWVQNPGMIYMRSWLWWGWPASPFMSGGYRKLSRSGSRIQVAYGLEALKL